MPTRRSIELLPIVVAGFLRLTINRKIFEGPMSIGAAIDFVDSLFAIAGVDIPNWAAT